MRVEPQDLPSSGARAPSLAKTATGISGLDDVTGGGLPKGRPTLICGPAGCGKTLLAMEFLVRGITQFDEPGVFIAFEESVDDLVANVASLGFDLTALERDGKLVVDHITVASADIADTGDWDLDGLFLRIGAAIDRVGAKRIVIDTIENLFGAFSNTAILRAELHRLFQWLKDRGVTAIITAERGDGTLTRRGIEEYVSDCVIVLDHRVTEQTSTRRLRILKYRGSLHGTNEYPFLISDTGVSVLPITSLGLSHKVSAERVSTGVGRLDAMLGSGGFYKGSTVLVSGTAGTGKSTLAAQFCEAACARGERVVYFAFEESEAEIVRNMASVGIDLRTWVDADLLRFRCFRPSLLGLEAHLFTMQKVVGEFEPAVVVMDPVSDFVRTGSGEDVSAMLTRQVDFLKSRGVTALFTSLNYDAEPAQSDQQSDQQLASLVDTWLLVKTMEGNGEHNRVLYVRKSRGMAHSNQIREFLLTSQGIELADVYVGPQGVLTGSARQAQEAKERSDGSARQEDLELRRVELERKRESVEAQTAALWREFEAEADVVERLLSHGSIGVEDRAGQRWIQSRLRRADPQAPAEPDVVPTSTIEPVDDPVDNGVNDPVDVPASAWFVQRERRLTMATTDGGPPAAEPGRFELTLFVSGASELSARAIANARLICETHVPGRYELTVIDLHDDPDAALANDVIAAPTLVRTSPLPIRRCIGDLSRTDVVRDSLNLPQPMLQPPPSEIGI